MPIIAGIIVEAGEAMGLYTGTLKTKVGLVARISSHTCHATDINNTYRQCLVAIRPSTTFFTALTRFVNREVVKWCDGVRKQREKATTTA